MDVLTNVLNSIHLWGEVVCRFELTAPWGISIPSVEGAVFHYIDRGSCWLRFPDEERPVPLASGDLVVFPKARAHDVVDVPSSLPLPLADLVCTRGPDNLVVHHGRGGSPTTLLCGVFHREGAADHGLFSQLPPIIHIKGDQGRGAHWLDTTLKFMCAEAESTRPGAHTIVNRLTDILFVNVVRAWLERYTGGTGGWLTALGDPQIGPALGHMHGAPEERWTIGALSAQVGMSRSAFSARFSSVVGEPPLRYLSHWRMRLAASWLRDTDMSLGEIAERLGYQSEDPFKRAFKRDVGMAPGMHRRRARGGTDSAQATGPVQAA